MSQFLREDDDNDNDNATAIAVPQVFSDNSQAKKASENIVEKKK